MQKKRVTHYKTVILRKRGSLQMRLDAQHCDSHNIEENKLYKFFLKKLTTEGTLIIEMIGREDDTEAVIFSIPKNKAEYYNLNEEDTVLVIESEEIEREE